MPGSEAEVVFHRVELSTSLDPTPRPVLFAEAETIDGEVVWHEQSYPVRIHLITRGDGDRAFESAGTGFTLDLRPAEDESVKFRVEVEVLENGTSQRETLEFEFFPVHDWGLVRWFFAD